MNFPNILPPNDLLKQVEGIESGLRQRQRLGVVGLLATVTQVFVLIANNQWFTSLLRGDWTGLLQKHWPYLIVLAGGVFTLVLTTWARFWIQESQEPFRYTYSIADFTPVPAHKTEGPHEDRLSFQMSHDLAERLNERIKRLALLDEDIKANHDADKQKDLPPGKGKRKSHIHIRGYYMIRQKPDCQWFVEVMPRVRIGEAGSAETLAHPVKFKLPKTDANDPEHQISREEETAPGDATHKTPSEAPPRMTPRQYEQILERIYFSVATEIYKQIQSDVQRKIELLPTKYFRAVALFHEAEDYANSNTLDAYQEARNLYDQALNYFNPDWRPLPKFFLWKLCALVYRRLVGLWSRLKRKATIIWPRLGRMEIMCARAEIGYANMLLYRRALATLSGQRVNASFQAPDVAAKAVNRVRDLAKADSRSEPTLFDAYVTLALAWFYLGSSRKAAQYLGEARALLPVYADMNSRYLFVSGTVEPRMRPRLNLFRHAVEIDPRFEVAQFSLAAQIEDLWRTRPELERNIAEEVFKEYDEVLKLNPGNIGAWARQGYIRWLLAQDENDLQKAREAFEDGREYKEIKRETFVAELDYGLARIAAEKGDFATAYAYFSSAVSAHLAQGIRYGSQNTAWSYQIINRALAERIASFKEIVEGHFKLWVRVDDHDRWQDRSFQEVIDELTDPDRQDIALRGILATLDSVSPQLTSADRERLKGLTGTGDLRSLANQLTVPPKKVVLRMLRSPILEEVIGKYLPTLRIRKSVYAFVLTQYGEACDNYYLRSGDGAWLNKAREAFQEALDLNPQYVIPRYRLFEKTEDDDPTRLSELEKIVDIEPDWPDGVLALAEERARRVKTKQTEATQAIERASTLAEEAKRQENEEQAKKRLKLIAKEQTDQATEALKKFLEDRKRHSGAESAGEDPLDDPRRLKKASSAAGFTPGQAGGGAEQLHDSVKQAKKELQAAQEAATRARQEPRELAKQAVDGVRKLLPFRWADRALNEEIEQSARNRQRDKDGEVDPAASREALRERLLQLAYLKLRNRSVRDVAGKGLSMLIESKEINWKKELEDIHVRALKTWGDIRPSLLGPQEARRVKGRLVLPGEELLCHIRKHFWPDDFQLHLTLRDLSKSIFRWEAVPGQDEQKLRDFLVYLVGAKWLKSAAIIKSHDESTIFLTKKSRTLKLKLDESRSRVCLVPQVEARQDDYQRSLNFTTHGVHGVVNWHDIPGVDEERFRSLMHRSFGMRWLKKASVAKSDDDTIITLSNEPHSLSLKFDWLDSKPAVITHEFKLNKTKTEVSNAHGINTVERDVCYLEYAQMSNEVISDTLNREWQGDRSSYVSLTWILGDPAINEEASRRIFSAVLEENGLSSSLYQWLGSQSFMKALGTMDEFISASNDPLPGKGLLEQAVRNFDSALHVYHKAMDINE
jgi:hypothetical protein